MDPLSIGIGAAGSLLGGIFSSSVQSNNIKRQLAAQREENALNRQFNAEEAQKSRDFASLMTDKQNAYNSPSAQVDRLVAAGLNPALMYGSSPNNTSDFMNSSAQGSSSGSLSPMGFDTSGISGAAHDAANLGLINAQAELAQAEALKIKTEVPWIDRLNSSIESLNKMNFDLGISEKELNEATSDLKRSEKEQVLENIEFIKQTVENLKSERSNIEETLNSIKQNNRILEAYADKAPQQALANLQKTFSEANLTKTQAYILGKSAEYLISMNASESRRSQNESFITYFNASSLKHIMDEHGISVISEKQWESINKELEVLDRQAHGNALDWTNAVGNIVGSAVGLGLQASSMGLFRAARPIGFR